MRLSPEDGTKLPGDSAEERAVALGQLDFDFTEPAVLPGEDVQTGPRSQAMISSALQGTLPRSRPLKYWEPNKLSPLHINMILDRASGLKPGEIAEKYNIDAARVAVVLNHPDALVLYSTVIGEAADALADPRKRIEGYAHEMLDVKINIARDKEAHPRLRNAIATDLLDRAGYGARHQVEVTSKHTIQMPEQIAARLADGLAEAARLREIPYAEFVQMGSVALTTPSAAESASMDGEIAQEGGLSLGTGHPEAAVDTSLSTHPSAAPATSTERVA